MLSPTNLQFLWAIGRLPSWVRSCGLMAKVHYSAAAHMKPYLKPYQGVSRRGFHSQS